MYYANYVTVNQASLEEHYRKRHPKSPPPKVQPAATSSQNPADEPESEQVEPSQNTSTTTARPANPGDPGKRSPCSWPNRQVQL